VVEEEPKPDQFDGSELYPRTNYSYRNNDPDIIIEISAALCPD
jgi:hypothetical protein